jgi:ABC-2 type transport system permease protein
LSSLIYNELLKIVKQKFFIAPCIILFIPVIILGRWEYVDLQKEKQAGTDWKQELIEQNEKIQQEMTKGNLSAKLLQDELKLNEYRLKHNIPPNTDHSVLGFMNKCADLVPIVSLILITYASSMVSKEYQWGTMNLLMVRPATRTEILLSKFAAVVVLYMILCGILALFSLMEGLILYGFRIDSYPTLKIVDGKVVEQSVILDILKSYSYQFLPVLFFATVAFTISTILRSNGPAIIVAVVTSSVSDPIAQLLSKYDWSKYLVFANTDLRMYEEGAPLIKGMTLGFSVTMLFIYISLLLFLSLFVFKRRDI